ncbi:MAG: PilZ domain-containing protein [Erythrobacter sp.]|nr:PilZ domain-containing protein [Erythrobacter sp.]
MVQLVDKKLPALAAHTQTGRRDAARLRLYLPARLALVDGVVSCIIEDISQTGAKILIQHARPIGQSGILQCPPLDVFFDRVWTDGVRVGVAFEEPVEPETLHALRQLHDNYSAMSKQELRRTAQDWVRGKWS